ncbi:MAG: AAA family ATPase [Candidatus Gracilibacteria bacterium]|jgi:DNA polymerase-3 subunit delta'
MKYTWGIIGHEKELAQIEADIETGNLSHAYLLAGQNSIGKFTVAKKMAGILQCNNNFCHECSTCIQVQKGSHLDTIELLDNGESLKIDQIRSLIERICMSKQSNYKIILMQTVERMPREAANSFLKTLEEPPANTIFVMTTNNVRAILPTILSRTRIINFKSLPIGYLEGLLKEHYPDKDPEAIKHACIFSLGRVGKAVHLIESPEALSDYVSMYHDIRNFLEHKSVVSRFSYVNSLLENEGKVSIFLDILAHVLRSKLLENPSSSQSYINTLLKLDEGGILLKKNVNDRLVLENLMLAL